MQKGQLPSDARSKFRRMAWSVSDEVQDLWEEVNQLRLLLETHTSGAEEPRHTVSGDSLAATPDAEHLRRSLAEMSDEVQQLRAEVSCLRKATQIALPGPEADGSLTSSSCMDELRTSLNAVSSEVVELQNFFSREISDLRAHLMRVEIDSKADSQALDDLKSTIACKISQLRMDLDNKADSKVLNNLQGTSRGFASDVLQNMVQNIETAFGPSSIRALDENKLCVEIDNYTDSQVHDKRSDVVACIIDNGLQEELANKADSEVVEKSQSAVAFEVKNGEADWARAGTVEKCSPTCDMHEEFRVAVDRHVQDIRTALSHDVGELRMELHKLADTQKLVVDRRLDLQAQQVEEVSTELSRDVADLRAALKCEAERVLVEQKKRENMQDDLNSMRSETMHLLGDMAKVSLTVAQMHEDKEAEKIQRKPKLGQCFWPMLAHRGGA